jgi:hypothetical protein
MGRTRTVKLNDENMEIMRQQLRKFREKKFGREPGPDDPVFFNPDADTPQPFPLDKFTEESAQAMARAGIRPEMIYAHRKTGLVTEENRHKLLPEDMAVWEAAVDEYFDKAGGEAAVVNSRPLTPGNPGRPAPPSVRAAGRCGLRLQPGAFPFR